MSRTFEVLSTHRVIAEFLGIQHIPCRHLTSLCPDRCNHGQDCASFKVISYEKYEALGRWASEEQEVFYARVDQKVPAEAQDPAIIEIIKSLTPGQKVKLYWEHIYVTDQGSKWPERPIRSLEPA
jgi:hypothetical protein